MATTFTERRHKLFQWIFHANDGKKSAAELGTELLELLYLYRVLKKPMTEILQPFLDSENDLECLLTGSSKDERYKMNKQSVDSKNFKEVDSDYDIMLIMNKKSIPVGNLEETSTPGFYNLHKPSGVNKYIESFDEDTVNSNLYIEQVRSRIFDHFDQNHVFIKPKQEYKSSPAIAFRIETGLANPKHISFDLVPAFRTEFKLNTDEVLVQLKEKFTKQPSYERELMELPIFIIAKSISSSKSEWRLSYSLHEERIMKLYRPDNLYCREIEMLSQYLKDKEANFNILKLPSFVFKTMYIHYLIHNFREYSFEECILEDQLPLVFNTKIRILSGCIESSWKNIISLSNINSTNENDFILLKNLKTKRSMQSEHNPIFIICKELQITKEETPLHFDAMTDGPINISERENHLINRTFHGMTPLFVACLFGNYKRVEELLICGADKNINFTKKQITCLHIACWAKTKSRVSNLYQKKAQNFPNILKNICKFGTGVLENNRFSKLATQTGFEKDNSHNYSRIIKLLINSGSDVNCVTTDGLTPLYLSCQNGDLDSANFLVENGATVDNGISWRRYFDFLFTRSQPQPLFISALNGELELTKFLLKHGANTKNTTTQNTRHEYLLFERKAEDQLVICAFNLINNLFLYCQTCKNIFLKKTTHFDINYPLHAAVFTENVDIVKVLIDYGADIDTQAASGETTLTIASEIGNVEIVQLLLDQGANVQLVSSDDGITALIVACQNDHREIADILIRKGALINNSSKDGTTALIKASESGHISMIDILTRKGADVNKTRNDGVSALIMASTYGHLKIVQHLAENGASINARRNDDGTTALLMACQNGYPDVARILADSGADVNQARMSGETALIMASQEGHLKIAELLINKQANVNDQRNTGSTALLLASQNGHEELCQLLLANGAHPNTARQDGNNSLTMSSRNGSIGIAKLLLEYGADVNVANSEGATSLLFACQNGHVEMVHLLTVYHADVNKATNNKTSPLMLASQNGHLEITRILLEHDADITAVDYDGDNALIMASRNGRTEVVNTLLQKGAQIDSRAYDGYTALIMASASGQKEIVKMLIEHKADVNAADNSGITPLIMANVNGNTNIAEILKANGATGYSRMTLLKIAVASFAKVIYRVAFKRENYL